MRCTHLRGTQTCAQPSCLLVRLFIVSICMGIEGVIQTCSIDTRCPNDAQRRILIGHGQKFQKIPSRLLGGGEKRDNIPTFEH